MKELQIIHEKMMDLRCCGNCKKKNECIMDANKKGYQHNPSSVCDYWRPDGVKHNERRTYLVTLDVYKKKFPSRVICRYKPEEMEGCEDYVEWEISEFASTCMWLDRDDKKTCYDPTRRKDFDKQSAFDFNGA